MLAESGVQQTPVPPESSYFQELWLAFQQWVLDFLKRSTVSVPPAVLIGIAGVVAVLAVLLLARALLPRYRARQAKAREEAGAVVAVGAAPAPRDAASWRAELERRLAEGRAAEALEAAWWWLARSVAGDRVEPDWTSRDLLAQARREDPRREDPRREDLTDVVRRLDVLTYGPDRPGLQEVRTLVGRLEAVLA
ncbi:MAG TPA: hypothetical protein VLQ45_22545 [Thermoanaerobaculia bacterium]|nr:hypothetical protein [Thermoanaerobaculia bacterium]